MSKENTVQIRDSILEAALPDATFDGWSWELVETAALKTQQDLHIARAVFPDKLIDVLDHFADWADRKMLENLKTVNPEDLRIRDRIREAVLARFKILAPHKEALRDSAQFWALPPRQIRATKIIWRTSSRIWDWAGDTATDYNRYTKRGLLSGILTSTTLVWLNDDSADIRQTKEFLDRRIENVLKIGGTLGKVLGRFKKGAA